MRFFGTVILAASGLCLVSLSISAQTAPPTLQVPNQSMYIQKVAGATDGNVYKDEQGNLYTVTVKPMNSVSCDSGGCTVMVCQGGGDKSPCNFYRCTNDGVCKPLAGAS